MKAFRCFAWQARDPGCQLLIQEGFASAHLKTLWRDKRWWLLYWFSQVICHPAAQLYSMHPNKPVWLPQLCWNATFWQRAACSIARGSWQHICPVISFTSDRAPNIEFVCRRAQLKTEQPAFDYFDEHLE
jgi:hypothetical protein